MTSARGFTLIEVLVALLIVSLALTAVSAAMAMSQRSGTVLRERTYASWIAQNKITELRLEDQIPATGRTNGTLEYANAEWRWEAVVEETGIENLHRIDVSVSLLERDQTLMTVTGFASLPGDRLTINAAWLNTGSWGPVGGEPGATPDGVER